MWVPKYVRDEKKGVDSPIPTQVISNEEIYPRPIHKQQLQVESLIMELVNGTRPSTPSERPSGWSRTTRSPRTTSVPCW